MSKLKVNAVETYSGTALTLGTAADTVTVVGSTVVGQDANETVAVNAKVNTDIIPDSDASRNLGSPSARWILHASATTFGSLSTNTMTTSGTSDLTLSASQDIVMTPASGYVGVGTATPNVNLHVKPASGNARFKLESDDNSADVEVRLDSASSERNAHITFYNDGIQKGGVGYVASDTMMKVWGDNNPNDDHLCIKSDGSIGIGTPTPAASLHIKRANDSANHLTFEQTEGSGKKYHMLSDDAGAFVVKDDSATRIYVKTDGKVGIGNTSPTQQLHVTGDAQITSDLTIGGNLVVNGTTTTINSTTLTVDDKNIEIGSVGTPTDTTADGGGITLKGAADYTIAWANATNRWHFNQGIEVDTGDLIVDNNVGIGTQSPGTMLQLESNAPYITLKHSDPGHTDGHQISRIVFEDHTDVTLGQIQVSHDGTTDDTRGDMILSTHNGTSLTEALRIDSNQNVGIGINDPSAPLDVQKSGTLKANTDLLELTNSGNAADMDGTQTSILFNQWYYDASTPAVADAARISVLTEQDWTSTASSQDSAMALSTAENGTIAERVRITSAGNVGIGTSTPVNRLDVEGGLAVGATYSGTNTASANGAIIEGNVGIGTTTPANKLDVEGALAVGATYSGASTAPSNGAIIEGNVGIGTDAPSHNLHIMPASGNARLVLESDNNSADVEMRLDSASSSRNAFITFRNAGTVVGGVGYSASDSITKVWGSNNHNDDHLCIKDSGDIGIGTATPTAKLDIAANSVTTGNAVSISADGLTTGAGLFVESTNNGLAANGSLIKAQYTGNSTAVAYLAELNNSNAAANGVVPLYISQTGVNSGVSEQIRVRAPGLTGGVGYSFKMKEVTISTNASIAEDDNFFPPNSIPMALHIRVLTNIRNASAGATGINEIGMGASATNNIASGLTASNLQDTGHNQSFRIDTVNIADVLSINSVQKLRIGFDGTPASGQVRAVLWYMEIVPPTS